MTGRLLDLLARHAMGALCGGVFLGLVWPGLAALLAPALVASVFLLLVAALLRLDWNAVGVEIRHPGGGLLVVVWLLLLSPLLVFALLALVPLPAGLETALVLMACSSPIISSIPLAVLLRLDGPAAMIATVTSMLLVPFSVPALALLLLDLEISIGLAGFMARLGFMVGGPLAVAWILRRFIPPATLAAQASRIDGVAVLMMLVFAVAIMDGVTAAFLDRPGHVLLYLAAAFAANLLLQATGAAAFLWRGRGRAVTCGLMSGNRNMALLLAALAGQADFGITLFFAVAQLPIYILPALLRPLYRRLAGDGQAGKQPPPAA